MISTRVCADHLTLSRLASRIMRREILRRPSALVCLASGETPRRAYELLSKALRPASTSSLATRFLQLDEWGGLPADDPATCQQDLRSALIGPLGAVSQFTSFASDAPDSEAECARIARWLAREGPIDLCVLGLGMNGHLGFNEPAEALTPHAHVARLSPESMRHTMLGRTTRVPEYGLTLGMADLFQARRILLVVSGAAKREPLQRLLSGPISTWFPASFLHLHRHVHLLCTADALPDTFGHLDSAG